MSLGLDGCEVRLCDPCAVCARVSRVLLFRPTVKYIELMILWRDALFKVACVDSGLP